MVFTKIPLSNPEQHNCCSGFPFITFSYTIYYIKSTFSKIFDIIYLSKLIYISLLDRDIMDEYIRLLHYNLSKITI